MSSVLGIKLRRDLRASWSRFALMVLAITVSLTAFAAVLFAWAASGRESSNAYAGTEPASATIVLDQPVDASRMAEILAQVRTRPDVIAATGRTQFDSDIEVNGKPIDIPLQVFVAAPDDPMRMATFQMSKRAWPPSPDEIFINRDALALLGVAVGDTVTVHPPGGQAVRLRVADTVYDPSLSPSPQEQRGRAYLSAAALAPPGGAAMLDQLKLQIAKPGQGTPSRDRTAIVATAGGLGQWLQTDYQLAIREIQVPTPYAHPHQWQADALLAALLAGAAASLLLSVILAATMLGNLFTQQIPQIGIMKAIGARSGRIGRFYLVMILLVAAAATTLAVGPAVWLGRTAVATFLGFLGIQPESLAAPWWTYLVVIGLGVGLPPLIALTPLVKASRTTVRSAIDHHGGTTTPGMAARLVTRLSSVSSLDRGLLLALRNTVRRPARFWLSAGLLATAGMVFVAGMSLAAGTQAITEEQKQERTWDADIQLAAPTDLDEITRLASQVPGVARAEALRVAPAGVAGPGQLPVTRTYPDQGHGRVAVTAIPPGTTTVKPPKLLEGRWLTPGETGAVVLNQLTVNNTVPGTRAGDTVQLIVAGKTTTWTVAGIAEETGHGAGVYTTAEGFAAAMGQPPQATTLRIITTAHSEPDRQQAAADVAKTLASAGIAVKSATSVSRSEAISQGHLGPVILILLGIALPLGVIGAIGLASTMSANVLDRTREFGIMHAIGARPKTVRRIVIAEGIILAVVSCLLAALPALGLTAILGNGLGSLFFDAPLPYRISLPAVLIWAALAVLGAILATDAAARRAGRITVRQALTHL